MIQLDVKDKKILYELDIDARQPDSEIARKVKLSREVVAYRINRLINKGIIRNFVTILNHHALGYWAFRIFFKFRDLSAEKEKEIVDFLKDKVAWLVRVRGVWSFNCMIFTKDIFSLEETLNKFRQQFYDIFVDMRMSIITRIYHYRRGYILNKDKDESEYDVMGKVVRPPKLDETDHKILDVIQNNARLTSMEISQKLKISERMVRYRVKNLINSEVILGFRSLLDLGKLGLSYFKVHFKLKRYTPEILKKISGYAHLHPHIVYKTETVGGSDLELELQYPTSKELYNFLDKFIQHFPGIIEDYEILEYDKEYKLSYLNVL